MKSQGQQPWFKRLAASVMTLLVSANAPLAAAANPDRTPRHAVSPTPASTADLIQLQLANQRESRRAARIEARRELMRESAATRHSAITPAPTTQNLNEARHNGRSHTVSMPGQVSPFRTTRPHSTYINDSGRTRSITRNVSFDLSSTNENITVGENVLSSPITIQVGGETKQVAAGSKVTAAEFAALNQKLLTGNQSLTLSSAGAAEGGSVDLNVISDDGATIRASQLIVPKDVTVTADFGRTADGVRVTKDVVNYGSLIATSSNANRNTAVIGARDIINQEGASIASQSNSATPELNLALRADRDINNQGSITSSGDLELSAGHAISNGTAGSTIHANGNVILSSAEINNHGSISSETKNITLAGDAGSPLIVNNYGGTLTASNGAINVRSADYAGTFDTTVYGGNYVSKELNINAGEATANLTVNDISGVVSSTGLAVHVSANADTLVLGNQCLTGDPTYYNRGNIILGGTIIVDEDLAIISGGDITAGLSNVTVRARGADNIGHNITIIAGANVTAGSGEISPPGGPATLPQQIGTPTQNTTAPVTFSTNSTGGGSINLTAATTFIVDSQSLAITTGINKSGGNITLAAFAGSNSSSGQILFNTSQPNNTDVNSSGNGTGNNGNISIIAGAVSGTAIQMNRLFADGGSGAAVGTGAILIANAQPTTSNGLPITYATNGSVTTGNSIVPSSTVANGIVSVGGSVTGSAIRATKSVTISSGANTIIGDITGGGDLVKITSVGDLTVNTITNAKQSLLLSQGNITFRSKIQTDDGVLAVAGKDLITGAASTFSPAILTNKAGNTGNISLIAGAAFTVNPSNVSITGVSAFGGAIRFSSGTPLATLSANSSNNGAAGNINLIAYRDSGHVLSGKITLPTALAVSAQSNGVGFNNGNILIVAGANTSDAITMGGVNGAGPLENGTGSVTITTSTPGGTIVSPVLLATTTSGFAGVTSGSFTGGALLANGGITISGAIAGYGSPISISAGSGGVICTGDVTGFGLFQINSLGNITMQGAGNSPVVKGAGEGQNRLLWTALGNISFNSHITLHAPGGGSLLTGGGGGVVMVAGGTVQSIASSNTDTNIDTSSTFDSGNITVVAGAAFTQTANDLTITGQSLSGGSILFNGASVGPFTGANIQLVDSHSQLAGFKGGDINLISFGFLQVNSTAGVINASGNGSGKNGNVTIVSPNNIVIPKINMASNGGSVTIYSATPSSATIDLTNTTTTSFGKVLSGSFLTGALSNQAFNFSVTPVINTSSVGVGLSIASNANITVGNIDVSSNIANTSGFVSLVSGANVSTGTIDVSNTSTTGDGGTITIVSNSATTLNIGGGGANGTGLLTANAGTVVGNGGGVTLKNLGSGGVTITNVPSLNITDGNGATLNLDAGTGNLDITTIGATITSNGVGTNRAGGSISLAYGTLTIPAGTITLTANGVGTGAGGSVSVRTTTGAGNIVIGSGSGEFVASALGGGGSISFTAGGNLTLSPTGSVDNADIVSLSAAGSVQINNTITTKDVRISSGNPLSTNNLITSDAITLVSANGVSINANLIAKTGILIVSGTDVVSNTNIDINASDATGDGGNVVIVAGAQFTESSSSITLTGASATGGDIDFTIGGGSLNQITTSTSNSGSAGGKVTLMAFANGANGGLVQYTPSAPLVTSGSAPGQSGNVVIIGQAASSNAVNIGNIDTSLGAAGSGQIAIAAASPVTGTAGPLLKANASYTGTFLGGTASGGNLVVGNLSSNASVSLSTDGSIQTGTIATNVGATSSAGGSVSLTTGDTGSLSVTSITTTGAGTGSGGAVNIHAGSGALTLGTILANGGGSGGNGAAVTLNVGTATPFSLPSTIQAQGTGASGNGGTLTIINRSTGGIDLNPGSFNIQGTGAGGSLIVDAGSGALTSPGAFSVSANAGSASFANGTISLTAGSASMGGTVTLTSTGGLVGSGSVTITTSTGGFATNGGNLNITTNGSINLDTNGNAVSTSSAIPGSISLISGGSIIGSNATFNTSASSGTNDGGNLTATISSGNGGINLGAITANGSGATGKGGNVSLTASVAGITLSSISSTGTGGGGAISLTTNDGDITAPGVITTTTPTGSLQINLNGATPGTANLSGNNLVAKLNATGGGTINFNAGPNPIVIGSLGGTQTLTATTTDAVSGITINTTVDINTTGTLTFNTPKFTNSKNITARSILVQNLTGNLAVDGGANGSMTGTFPTAGPPGFPSVPTAIIFNTANGAALNLSGHMTFTGDVTFNNVAGTTTSNNGSLFAGNNNVFLDALNWNQIGTGTITGNTFVFRGLTIINTSGDVVIPANAIFHGRNLVIAASRDIILTNFQIDLSSNVADGGNLNLIAGFNFTPPSVGQENTQAPFTLTGPSTSGGNITGTAVISTNTTGPAGNGGSVTAVAHGGTLRTGTISLGNITTSSTNGIGGSVSLIASSNITTGNITSTGGTTSGNILVSVSDPQAVGTVVVDSGRVISGSFTTSAAKAGTISVGGLNAGTANLSVTNLSGAITVSGAVAAHDILLSTQSALTFSGTSTISAAADSSGDGGSIDITASTVTTNSTSLTINAIGTGSGDGGTISLITGNSNYIVGGSGSNLVVNASGPGAAGQLTLHTDGDITINTGGINLAGTNGAGAIIDLVAGATDGVGTIAINDSAFLAAANATGSNGDGGMINLDSQLLTFTSLIGSPLTLNANGIGTGDGGIIRITNDDPTATFIGAPAKAPKPPVNFLSLSAKSGTAGGNGGEISVAIGGSLTVNTANMQAGPQSTSGSWNGAIYTLASSNPTASKKSGFVAITGNLNANGVGSGTGGQILITSNYGKAFTFSTKAVSNGIFGTLSATGTGGLIQVENDGGGIAVSVANSITARDIMLKTAGKGGITTGSGLTLTAANSLTLTSNGTGGIGKSPLLVNTPNLSVSSVGGSVNVSDTLATAVTLTGAGAGGSFTLATAGGLNVASGIATTSGAIILTAGGGTLDVATGLTISANNGAITMSNSNTSSGDINIHDGATIATGGKGGNVVIAIGAPPKSGTNTNPPPGFVLGTQVGKGTAFYGPGGLTSTGTVTVNVKNRNVIFNNLSTNTSLHQIVVGNLVTVTADPPSRAPHVSNLLLGDSTFSTDEGSATPSINSSINFDPLLASSNNASRINLLELPATESIATDGNTIDSEDSLLIEGNVLFTPSSDTTIQTSHGKVKLAAGAIALVVQSDENLAVFDLHDNGKNSVVIEAHDKRISLSPGRHLTISKRDTHFSEVNQIELVQHRGLNQFKLNNGCSVHTSEFSILSACYAVKAVNCLMTSNDRESKKLANRILKTASVVMTINPDRGDFVQHFKPAIAAYQR